MSERVFERANQYCGAYRSLVHRPTAATVEHVAVVHQ